MQRTAHYLYQRMSEREGVSYTVGATFLEIACNECHTLANRNCAFVSKPPRPPPPASSNARLASARTRRSERARAGFLAPA